MSSNKSGVGRTEAISATIASPTSNSAPELPTNNLAAQMVQLTAVIAELTTRLTSPSLLPPPSTIPVLPDPVPPFPTSFPAQRFPHIQTPSIGISTIAHRPPPASTGISQTLNIPATASSTEYTFPDLGGSSAAYSRQPQSVPQTWKYNMAGHLLSDRMPISRPQSVSASSCWGPPRTAGHSGASNTDQRPHTFRMEPPRFDGTEVNNWIRGIQFYFDHVGTPEAQRLHYVIMLFEPVVADWIWNYCDNHEFVTWPDFLDDVRCRFDPQCYVSHVGLLKKLQQTGTVSEYQLAFEKLQSKAVGVPDHILLDLYVAGLKQPTCKSGR